jgi:hypothetical protein
MKKIGLFLATTPHMGGMFQYGQTLLTALAALPKNIYETTTICGSDEWVRQARELGLPACREGKILDEVKENHRMHYLFLPAIECLADQSGFRGLGHICLDDPANPYR